MKCQQELWISEICRIAEKWSPVSPFVNLEFSGFAMAAVPAWQHPKNQDYSP
jgi:hypothetical protein